MKVVSPVASVARAIHCALQRIGRGRLQPRSLYKADGVGVNDSLSGFPLKIFLGSFFILQSHNLVGIEADHQISNMVVDFGELMAGSGGDDDHVAGLQEMLNAVRNRNAIASGPIQQSDILVRSRTSLPAYDVGTCDKCR